MPHSHSISQEMRQCIQNCLECHSICVETAQHCLTLGGEHAGVKHVRLLLDCAQICQTCSDFMLRTSHYHTRTCGVCAEVCRDCAKSCEQMAGGDETMKKCAEMCRRCSQSCEQMSKAAV